MTHASLASSVRVDPARFAADFPRRPFLVDHVHHEDPRLTLDAVVELALQLPPESVEYNTGDLHVNQDPKAVVDNGLGIRETLSQMGQKNSWMVLKNIERAPAYAALLRRSLAAMAPEVRQAVGAVSDVEGFIFVSSPSAVTPFHNDPEHNFLFQVQGTKTVRIWDVDDRVVVTEALLEAACAGAHRNLPHRPEYDDRAQVFELQPGVGLHFPVQAPHWVENGPEVSISYSFTFRSPLSHGQRKVRFVNGLLRRAGLTPQAVGESTKNDAVKLRAYDALAVPMAVARRSRTLKKLFLKR